MVDSSRKDTRVEVRRTGQGFKNAWYPATIVTPRSHSPKKRKRNKNDEQGSIVVVKYQSIFTDAAKKRRLVEKLDRAFIRPAPPSHTEPELDKPFEPNDVVDALNDGVWWTGVLLRVDDDNCTVFFKDSPDLKDFHLSQLRPHWDWVEEKWSPSQKQEIQYSKFKPGTPVEVHHKTNNTGVTWIPATVIGEKGTDSVVVRCKKDKAEKITVQLEMFRPEPPQLSSDKDFQLMDRVDAFCDLGWSVGSITKVLIQRRYAVNFGTMRERNEVVFNHSKLRLHLEWVDGQWITNSGEVVTPPTQQLQTHQVCDTATNIDSPPTLDESSGSELNVTEKQTPCSTNKDDAQMKELQQPSATATNVDGANSPKVNGNVQEAENSNVFVEPHGDEYDISVLLSFEEGDQNPNGIIEKRGEHSELQAANSQDNNEERNTPFVKRSKVWKLVESLEVFQKLPQKPHFHPLLKEEGDEIEREALALSYMVKFAFLIEKIFNLGEDGSMADVDFVLTQLTEMEKMGFDVKIVKNNLNEWRRKKVELEEVKAQIALHTDKKAKIDEELKIIEEKRSSLMSASAHEASQVSKWIGEADMINEAINAIMESS
ncbi:DUF724 domain-containing protein 7-like [Humulus lupulus]|uniref:DUF724 domain-containing protein 7-like n=1 Tax=Humulus lupulus TaxID=3486 RepID=UPI002B40F31D|nr:DUF724 domain-containing protein 7-like [Humulus lupulus]